MTRPNQTGEAGTVRADAVGMEQPVERLRAGGRGRPLAVALATAVSLATLIWQPWGSGPPPPAEAQSPRPSAPIAAERSTPNPAASVYTSAPSAPPSEAPSTAASGSETYVSLIDNEWTVVALMAANGPVSTEEPATQHQPASPWTPGDPLLVLQQWLNYTVGPLDTADGPESTCGSPDQARFRTTVPLPAGRVVYLGVTFPGMDPRAKVTAQVMQRAGVALKRQSPVVVPLSGQSRGQRYTVPSTGAGGAVMFAAAPLRILPYATYRFDIETPGIAGHRYLYACIGA